MKLAGVSRLVDVLRLADIWRLADVLKLADVLRAHTSGAGKVVVRGKPVLLACDRGVFRHDAHK